MSQNLVSGSTAGNSNILEENIRVLVMSSIGRKMWVMLSVYQAGHERNVEQKCRVNPFLSMFPLLLHRS